MAKRSKNIVSSLWWGLGVALTLAANPAHASEQFDNQAIQFDKDTIVEFEFVESRGAYQSTFGVINLNTGEKTPLLREVKPSDNNAATSGKQKDFLGTPGNTVPQPLSEFTFKANTSYALYLESSYGGKQSGIVYSSNGMNQAGNKQTQFSQDISGLGDSQGIKIRWDDTGSTLVKPKDNDNDYNDFTVIVGGFKGCAYYDGCPCNPQPPIVPQPQPQVEPIEVTVPPEPTPAPKPRAPRARG